MKFNTELTRPKSPASIGKAAGAKGRLKQAGLDLI